MAEGGSPEFRDCHDDEIDADGDIESEVKISDATPREEKEPLRESHQSSANYEDDQKSELPLKKADLERVVGPAVVNFTFHDCHYDSDAENEEEREEEKTLVEESEEALKWSGRDKVDDKKTINKIKGSPGNQDDAGMSMRRDDEEKVGFTDGQKERNENECAEDQIQFTAPKLQRKAAVGDGESAAQREDAELLLFAARHGDSAGVLKLIQKYNNYGENCSFSVNCKGQQKSNRGWTPLHLASYFGHDKAVLVLLDNGANVNALNPTGDSPLHKAAYIGRQDIVQTLIEHGADVFAVNSDGMLPSDLAYGQDVKRMLKGAEQSQDVQCEQTLLHAASEGDLETMARVMKGARPPNVNCRDAGGNTPLHRASCSDQREAAIFLLQSGAKTDVKNSRGQTTCDMAQSYHIRQLLSVKPMQVVHSYVNKFEGPLYRAGLVRRRHLWVVLDQGMLTYYRNRADAYAGVKRQGYKSLEKADIMINKDESNLFCIKYSTGIQHLWMVDEKFTADLSREKWISALKEHRIYSERLASSHVIADSDSDSDNEGSRQMKKLIPMSSMQDMMKNAQTRQHLLEESVRNLTQWSEGLKKDTNGSINQAELQQRLKGIMGRSRDACSALSSCMAVMAGQEELRNLQLKQEQERTKNLQDALHALARQHDRLELLSASLSTSPRNNFFDVAPEFAIGEHDFHSVRDGSSSGGSSPYGSFDDQFSDTGSFYSVVMDSGGQRSSPAEGSVTQRLSDTENHSNNKPGDGEGVVSRNGGGQNGTASKSKDSVKNDVFTFGNIPEIIIPGCARERLPAPMYRRDNVTLWTVLKQCIGKELSKITMPVVFNEPLSFLQRCCEYIEHAHLLVKASMSDDPLVRMKYVTAFVVSASASNVDRFGKPFNPLLGETYELTRDDIDTKMLLEQVSHHPPVSAFHATSPHFEFHGAVHPKLKFWGKSMEVQPKGVVTIKLPKHGETYTFHNVLMCVHNLIVGRLWIEQYGTLEIINHKTGHKSTLNFKPAGWFGRDLHKIEGHITDKKGHKLCYLYGKWTEYICATDIESKKDEKRRKSKNSNPAADKSPPNSPGAAGPSGIDGVDSDAQILWQNLPRPEDTLQYYSFTSFAMKLNELAEGLASALPCTDSRLRPDIRLLENGDIDGASNEKHRLEEKQRGRRKLRHRNKETWNPLWFRADVNSLTGEPDWVYRGRYWDRKYSLCPDIF